jgi:hypothetical protein
MIVFPHDPGSYVEVALQNYNVLPTMKQGISLEDCMIPRRRFFYHGRRPIGDPGDPNPWNWINEYRESD